MDGGKYGGWEEGTVKVGVALLLLDHALKAVGVAAHCAVQRGSQPDSSHAGHQNSGARERGPTTMDNQVSFSTKYGSAVRRVCCFRNGPRCWTYA